MHIKIIYTKPKKPELQRVQLFSCFVPFFTDQNTTDSRDAAVKNAVRLWAKWSGNNVVIYHLV